MAGLFGQRAAPGIGGKLMRERWKRKGGKHIEGMPNLDTPGNRARKATLDPDGKRPAG